VAFYEGNITVGIGETEQPFTIEKIRFAPGNAFFSIEGGDIRYRYGGSDPGSDSGHIGYQGQTFSLSGVDIENFKVIGISGSPVLQFTVKGR
jgi:hypothetical protein